jgi:hypothetical protein
MVNQLDPRVSEQNPGAEKSDMLGCEIDVSVLINVEKNELVLQLIFQWK